MHRDRIATAQRTAADLDDIQADLADVQAEVQHLEDEEARRDSLRDAINALNEEKAELRALNQTLYGEMQAIKARIDDVQAAEATCPTCGQPLDEARKAALLEELVAEGTERGDQHRGNQTRLTEITETIAAHRAEIEAIEVELRKLQALRDRAAALNVSLECARNASDTIRSEQAGLAAVEDLLESGEYAEELQAQRERDPGRDRHAGLRLRHAQRRPRDALHLRGLRPAASATWKPRSNSFRRSQTALANATARRDRWLKVLDEERADVAAAQAEIDRAARAGRRGPPPR